ncbi:hypothetical protein [Sulfitobacter geojensis]|nr:hypothetical protein [Sulfitobacter geojensis]MBM1711058.1 hypothetical protein [Sulfitobacter geojensis]
MAPEVRSALLQAQTLLAFRLSVDDVRYAGSRFLLAQNETTLQSLSPEQLAVSHHQYELNAALRWFEQTGKDAEIVTRSRQSFAMRRSTIDKKIERFLQPKGAENKEIKPKRSKVVVRGVYIAGETVHIAHYDKPVQVLAVTKTEILIRQKADRNVSTLAFEEPTIHSSENKPKFLTNLVSVIKSLP